MAIAWVSVTSTSAAAASTITIPTFATSGTDRAIFVGVDTSAGGTAHLTTSVIRGGSETFTEVWDLLGADVQYHSSGHYFVAPGTGTATVVCTLGGTEDELGAGALVFTGVNQTAPVGTATTNSTASSSSPATVTIASPASTSWIFGGAHIGTVSSVAEGANQPATAGADWSTNVEGVVTSVGTTQLGSAGAVISWTYSGTSAWTIGAIEFKVSGPSITTQPVNQTVYAGQTATFTITATASAGVLHYQWKDDGSNVGTDSSSYTTAATVMADNRSIITCVLTDDNGSVTSGGAVLYVLGAANIAWTRA